MADFNSVDGGLDAGHLFDDAYFVSAASNELVSPLILLRHLSMIAAEGDMSQKDLKKVMQRLVLTSERALRIASSFGYAVNQESLPLEAINPTNICVDVIKELKPLMIERDARVDMKIRSKSLLLLANRKGFERVVSTLVDNAIQYSSTKYPAHLTITGTKDKVRVAVRDFGPAVPTDLWLKLDSRLRSRAPAPLASRPRTSVVGLLAAKKIAELMNCKMGVVRHRDGATFYIEAILSRQTSLL